MFPGRLFSHAYDIDIIINALCSETRHWLDTSTGHILEAPPTAQPTENIYVIDPLPPSFLKSLPRHSSFPGLPPQSRANILSIKTIQQLDNISPATREGGWLHLRLKEAALEWLANNRLLPPSLEKPLSPWFSTPTQVEIVPTE